MEVERPGPVIQRIKEDDHLQDLQTDELPLKKTPPSLVPPSSAPPHQQSASSSVQQQAVTPTTPPPPPLGAGGYQSGDSNTNSSGSGDDIHHGKHLLAASLIANKYLILDQLEGSALYTCINVHTQEELVCKVVSRDANSLLAAHYRLDCHPHINSLHEVLLGDKLMYLVFPPSHGDLHSHVRHRKRLREPEARRLFRQMAETVRACHDQGIVLRDLKLRKFVFADPQRTELKLETLEDAVVLEDPEDDILQDKRGCPAYVSPEILRSHARYSGRAADMWSLGVILYTMLVGRYPFNDSEHASLFAKISRGHFIVPECLSSRAKCLIRSLLRRDPSERLSASDVLLHPWLTREERYQPPTHQHDQLVPDIQI